jgi:hypothetical protein
MLCQMSLKLRCTSTLRGGPIAEWCAQISLAAAKEVERILRALCVCLPTDCSHFFRHIMHMRRVQYMEQLLGRHRIDARRLIACTPSTPEVVALLAVESHDELRLLPGMTASGVSHFQIWRDICAAHPSGDGSCSATLVLEDDVMLLRTWRAELAQLVAKAPADWELLYLDAWPGSCCWHFPFGCARRPAELLPADDIRFTSAYLIRPSAAHWLLARQAEAPHLRHETLLIELQQRGRAWHTLPKLALQLWDDVSDIATDAVAVATRNFYRTVYFPVFPRALYDSGGPDVAAQKTGT